MFVPSLKVQITFWLVPENINVGAKDQVYEPGTILEVKDVERAQDLITRELCKEFKGKTAPTFVL